MRESKVPAHASRLVRKPFKLKIFLRVAGIDECSYSDVGYGPEAPCNTAQTKQTSPSVTSLYI